MPNLAQSASVDVVLSGNATLAVQTPNGYARVEFPVGVPYWEGGGSVTLDLNNGTARIIAVRNALYYETSADPAGSNLTPAQAAAVARMYGPAKTSQIVDCAAEFGTWNTTNDAANLQAIINAAPAGATIILPQQMLLTSQVVSDKSLKGQGMGHYRFARREDAPTIVRVDSLTLSPIKLTGTGIAAEDFHVVNLSSGTPTAGSAIVWEGVADGAGASSVKVSRISSMGFYDGTLTLTGDTSIYEISSCYAGHFVRFGYLIAPTAFGGDNADGEMRNCQSIANGNRSPLAGVGWLGGGGVKLLNHKTNAEPVGAPHNNSGKCKYGVLAAPRAGVNTTILQLVGGSHENLQSGGCQVYVDVNPSETPLSGFTFGGQISGVEVNGGIGGIYAGGSSSYGVRVKGTSSNRIKAVSVIAAKWLGGSAGVDASFVDDLIVLGCSQTGIQGDSPRHINTDGTVRRLRTDYGSGDGPRTLFFSSGTGAAGSSISDGNNTPPVLAWELDNVAVSTQLVSAAMSAFTDTAWTWTFAGIGQGGGAVLVEERYAIYWAGSGNNPTFTLLSSTYRNAGATVLQGAAFAAFSAAGNTAGTVTLAINKQGAATALVGKLTLKIDGVVKQLNRLLA